MLINTFVEAHLLDSNVTPFHTSGARALIGLTWGCHLCSLPMVPAAPAQAGAFTSSMSHIMYLPPSLATHPGDLDSDLWTVAGLILGQPGDHWTLILVIITKADPGPGSCSLFTLASPATIWTPGHSQLQSLSLPYSFSWGQWNGAGKAPALLAMAPNYPALGQQLTLTCTLIPGLERVIPSSQHKFLSSSWNIQSRC